MNKKETIIKREDGSRIKITVRFIAADYKSHHRYSIGIEYCLPRKRRFNYVPYTAQLVTDSEILQAKLLFWESLKPTI